MQFAIPEGHGGDWNANNYSTDRLTERKVRVQILHLIAQVVKPASAFQESRHPLFRSAQLDPFYQWVHGVTSLKKRHTDLLQRIKNNFAVPTSSLQTVQKTQHLPWIENTTKRLR
jgi:hypothetical protein